MKKSKSCHCCSGTGKEYDNVAVGNDLRVLREKMGLTQQSVGLAMGYSKGYIHDLERGRRNWSDKLVADYRKACS